MAPIPWHPRCLSPVSLFPMTQILAVTAQLQPPPTRVPALNTLWSIKLYFCHSWQWRAVPPAPASSCNIFSGGWSVLQICASGEQLTQTHNWAASVLGSWLSHCAGVPAPVHHTLHPTPHSHLTLAYNPAHSDTEEGSLGIVSKMNIINRTE